MRAAMIVTLTWLAACGDGTGGTDGPGVVDCGDITPDRLKELGLERQLVLNLALASGSNYGTLSELGSLPSPATFRDFADDFEALDLSGIDQGLFDPPSQVVDDLRTTGDLLEDALAAGDAKGDPAWTALHEFYTQELYVSHNSALGYYIGEAGCDG